MQGVAWHMWDLILYLKRHNIPVTKPNDTAMVRGVLKWEFFKTCVVKGTHATKKSPVLDALKKAIVASNPSIFTDDVVWGLAEGPPAASHGGEATGVARADSWNFEDVFQEADTLELSPPLGKPEPEIKDSANHYAILKRFLEDETMMLNMIEFVGSLELKCSWKWKVAKIMSNFMESFTARVMPQNGLRAVLQDNTIPSTLVFVIVHSQTTSPMSSSMPWRVPAVRNIASRRWSRIWKLYVRFVCRLCG